MDIILVDPSGTTTVSIIDAQGTPVKGAKLQIKTWGRSWASEHPARVAIQENLPKLYEIRGHSSYNNGREFQFRQPPILEFLSSLFMLRTVQ